MDPSKREEVPFIGSRKEHKSNILPNTAPCADNKNVNDLKQIKEIKEIKEPKSSDSKSLNSKDNKTDTRVLAAPLGAGGKQNRDVDRSKERSSTSRDDRDQPARSSLSLAPSRAFDNSITVLKHLKDSKVRKNAACDFRRLCACVYLQTKLVCP